MEERPAIRVSDIHRSLSIALITTFAAYFALRTHEDVTLRIEMTPELSFLSQGQVFWSGAGGEFAPERGAFFEVWPGAGVYEVSLPDAPGRIRIDPVTGADVVIEVRSLSLRRFGIPFRTWSGPAVSRDWKPWNDVAAVGGPGPALVLRATGPDPGIASVARQDAFPGRLLVDASLSVLAGLSVAWLARRGERATRTRRLLGQSLVIVALGAVLTEGAMRAYHHFVPVFIFPGERTRRFRGQPGALDYDFRLNSGGFKDVEPAPAKRPGTVRIIGLGDSFAFGVVPYEHNYLTVLEQHLGRVSPPAEVVNMGIPWTGPREYVEVLVQEGLPLGGDMVLVSFFIGNDFTDVQPAPPPRSFLLAFLRFAFMAAPSALPVNEQGRYDDDAPTMGPERYLEVERGRAGVFRTSDPGLEQALPAVQVHLGRIKQVCDARGLELLVVLIPDEMQVDAALQARVVASSGVPPGAFDFELPNRRLREDLERRGIRCLDLLRPFQAAGRRQRLYRTHDTHWNIAGNRLAADLIRDELLRGDTKFWPRR